jgi:fimbrial isopeptide formation D2 family protein
MRKFFIITAILVLFLVLNINPALADSANGSIFTITKASAPATTSPSGTITYSITLRNNTDTNAAPLSVTDTLPAGFTLKGNPQLTTVSGGQVTFPPTVSGQVLTWTFDGDTLQSIPQNQQIVISYQVTASNLPGTYTNTACLAEPENICVTNDVVVARTPNTNIFDNVTTGILIGGIMIIIAFVITSYFKRPFEYRVLANQ